MQLREAKVVAVTFGSAVAIVLAVTATRQVSIWRDSSTLYTQALAVTGGRNPVVRRNLAAHYTQRGVALREGGNAAGALEFFELASAADFNSSSALFNHAVGLSELKRYSQAIPYYVRSLELDRGNADAWLNLGDAYVITGAFPAAAQAYRQTLTLRPDKYADYGLAWASAHIGDQEQAMRAFERLRAADPALAEDLRRRFDANR